MPLFKVIKNPRLDDAAVGTFKGLMELSSLEVIFLNALRNYFGQQICHINEHLLGRLERLRFHFRNEMPSKLIEAQRYNERDEKEGDPGETHDDPKFSKHHQIA